MPRPGIGEGTRVRRRGWMRKLLTVTLLVAVLAGASWAVGGLWREILAAGSDVLRALWTVPAIIALHLVQLLISAIAWRSLFVRPRLGLGNFFRLRLIRESLNSLLPVAHVGGEVIAVQLLARRGVAVARGTASVVVDVTMEVCSQLAFLLAGFLVLGWLSGAASSWLWAGSVVTAIFVAGGLLLAQRFGALRMLESVVSRIGQRWPSLVVDGLDGLNSEARAIYRRPRRLLAAFSLQGSAWVLGVGETWLILHALGVDASIAQAFVVESLGGAARSAGFAVPGALAIQEGGFVLAAAAVGLPELPALSLSLVKRVREVLVGLAGLAVWRLARGSEGRWSAHPPADLRSSDHP